MMNNRVLFEQQSGGSQDYPPTSTSPLQLTPVLVESQIQRIADTAASIIKNMPASFDHKLPSNKKKISKELEVAFSVYNALPNRKYN